MDYVTVAEEKIPKIGLGTWKLTGTDCRTAVTEALSLGYRHIDTAQAYGNEREIGCAIRRSDIDREALFLTTKLGRGSYSHDGVLRSVDESRSKLDTEYLDLLLIHWPVGRLPTAPALAETLGAMNELHQNGTVRHIGVSNFGVDLLHEARTLSDAPILTNQVQYHPLWDQTQLLDYCQIHNVMLTAYSPFGHGSVIGDPVLAEIGARYGKSSAQVALRWLLQQELVCAIPKASTRAHLEANIDVFDFELSVQEMGTIRRPSKFRTLSEMATTWLSDRYHDVVS